MILIETPDFITDSGKYIFSLILNILSTNAKAINQARFSGLMSSFFSIKY